MLIKKRENTGLMIPKLWCNTRITWMVFMKILRNTIPIKNEKKMVVFPMLSNKKLNQRVIELCIRGRKLNISLVFTR